MPDLPRAIAVAAVCGLLCACGSTASVAQDPPAATASAVTSSAAGSAPAAATSASLNGGSVPTTLVLDSSASKASYHAHEQLVGRNLPSEAVGTSPAVSGSILLAADGSIVVDQSKISVDLRQLRSDESRRDNFIQGNPLQTSRYPMAVFVPTQIAGLASPLPSSGTATFQLSGDLTVHGTTRRVTWQITAQFDETGVSGDATTQVNISDFGMTPPRAGPVLSIQDAITLELAFQAQRQA